MSTVTVQTKKNPRQQQRRRGPKKGKTTVVRTIRQAPRKTKPSRRRRNVNGNRQRMGGLRANRSARTALGLGATSFSNNRQLTTVVSNDEFITDLDVVNAPNFWNVAYPVNPGQSSTFPWLSRQSLQWEKYVFEMIEFYYTREVSEFNANGASGKVILSFDTDASDAPPTTKQQMESTRPHSDGMPCENQVLRLPAQLIHGKDVLAKFVRAGGLPGSSDIKTFDVGNLNVATQGIPGAGKVGELRVRYRCRFSVPVLEATSSVPTNLQVAILANNIVGEEEIAGLGAFQQMTLPSIVVNGIQATVDGVGSITLPPGNYLIDCSLFFDSSSGSVMSECEGYMNKNTSQIGEGLFYHGPKLQDWTSSIAPSFVTMNGTDTLSVWFAVVQDLLSETHVFCQVRIVTI